jgi:hypothetical protein
MKLSSRKIATMSATIDVTEEDIEHGECRLPHRCMVRVAVARELHSTDKDKSANHHVRVDAGHIRFNFGGFRWEASTHRRAKMALIRFDRGQTVKPFAFPMIATRKSKIVPINETRQAQVNAARRARAAEGRPDKVYPGNSIRKRVVGYA